MKESIEVRIGRYLAGEMSGEEKVVFQNDLGVDPELNKAYLAYQSIWQTNLSAPVEHWDVEAGWNRFENKIHAPSPLVRTLSRSVVYWAIAASVLLITGVLYFTLTPSTVTYQYSDSEHSQIELKDGSKVHLNKNSSLIVSSFTKHSRRVSLTGEAFFEVSPDVKRPFIISCGKTETQVVGTSFTLHEYLDQVHLFVNTGKVIFREIKNPKDAVALIAGEAAFFDDHQMHMIPNPSANAAAWHTRQLQFKKSIALSDAIKDVADYFDQVITIENQNIASCKISITLPFKNPEINTVLSALATAVGASVSQDGDKFVIKGGTCQRD